jgi:hypothetical protein
MEVSGQVLVIKEVNGDSKKLTHLRQFGISQPCLGPYHAAGTWARPNHRPRHRRPDIRAVCHPLSVHQLLGLSRPGSPAPRILAHSLRWRLGASRLGSTLPGFSPWGGHPCPPSCLLRGQECPRHGKKGRALAHKFQGTSPFPPRLRGEYLYFSSVLSGISVVKSLSFLSPLASRAGKGSLFTSRVSRLASHFPHLASRLPLR